MFDSRDPKGRPFTYDFNGKQYRALPVKGVVGVFPILVDPEEDYMIQERTAAGWLLVGYAVKDTDTKGEEFPWKWEAFYGADKYLDSFEGIRACIARISNFREVASFKERNRR